MIGRQALSIHETHDPGHILLEHFRERGKLNYRHSSLSGTGTRRVLGTETVWSVRQVVLGNAAAVKYILNSSVKGWHDVGVQ